MSELPARAIVQLGERVREVVGLELSVGESRPATRQGASLVLAGAGQLGGLDCLHFAVNGVTMLA